MAARDKHRDRRQRNHPRISSTVYDLSLLASAGNSTEIFQEDRKHYTSSQFVLPSCYLSVSFGAPVSLARTCKMLEVPVLSSL